MLFNSVGLFDYLQFDTNSKLNICRNVYRKFHANIPYYNQPKNCMKSAKFENLSIDTRNLKMSNAKNMTPF